MKDNLPTYQVSARTLSIKGYLHKFQYHCDRFSMEFKGSLTGQTEPDLNTQHPLGMKASIEIADFERECARGNSQRKKTYSNMDSELKLIFCLDGEVLE